MSDSRYITMPQPVKPATNTEATRPRLRGNSAEMWNCARWKVMFPRPSRMAAGMKALKPEEEETPNSTRASMLSATPAADRGQGGRGGWLGMGLGASRAVEAWVVRTVTAG
jgi:hypothetical protein